MSLVLSILAIACTEPPVRVGDGPPSATTETVMVAARDLPPDARITEAALQARLMPDNYVPPGTFRSPGELIGRVPRLRVLAQEPIVEAALHPADGVEAGHRGVMVELGSARPRAGETVDVWWRPAEASTPCIELGQLPVLRVDDTHAVLQVDASEALALATVARSPSVRLTVRAPGDEGVAEEVRCSR